MFTREVLRVEAGLASFWAPVGLLCIISHRVYRLYGRGMVGWWLVGCGRWPGSSRSMRSEMRKPAWVESALRVVFMPKAHSRVYCRFGEPIFRHVSWCCVKLWVYSVYVISWCRWNDREERALRYWWSMWSVLFMRLVRRMVRLGGWYVLKRDSAQVYEARECADKAGTIWRYKLQNSWNDTGR